MENQLIKNIDFDPYLVGFILTLNDDRIVQIQFDKCDDALNANYGKYIPHIDDENDYDLNIKKYIKKNINFAEEMAINEFIVNCEEIMKFSRVLNKIANQKLRSDEEFEEIESLSWKFYLKLKKEKKDGN